MPLVGDIGIIQVLQAVQPILNRMVINMPVVQVIPYRVTVTEHIDIPICRKVNHPHIGNLAFCKLFRKNHAVHHML